MPSCNDCGRFFTTPEALEYHSGWHHTEICPKCNQEMPGGSVLAGHLLMQHPAASYLPTTPLPVMVARDTTNVVTPFVELNDAEFDEELDEDSEGLSSVPTVVPLTFNSMSSGSPSFDPINLSPSTNQVNMFQCAWCESHLPQETMQQHIRDEHLTEILPEPEPQPEVPISQRPYRVVELAPTELGA